jgi:hypothetical protein
MQRPPTATASLKHSSRYALTVRPNFGGSDEPIGGYETDLPSTQIRYVNADVLALPDVSKLKAES